MENPYEYAMATEFVVPKQETDILADGPDYREPKLQQAFAMKVSKTLSNISKSLLISTAAVG